MKYILILSMLICNSCYGQITGKTSKYLLDPRPGFARSTPWLDSVFVNYGITILSHPVYADITIDPSYIDSIKKVAVDDFKKEINWHSMSLGSTYGKPDMIKWVGGEVVKLSMDSLSDSMWIELDSVSGVSVHDNDYFLWELEIKRDTVSVILLVCDTSWFGTSENTIYLGINSDRLNRPVYWKRGYSVRELHNKYDDLKGASITVVPSIGYFNPDYMKHLYYLDADKKPLSKNIIVWDEKEVK